MKLIILVTRGDLGGRDGQRGFDFRMSQFFSFLLY